METLLSHNSPIRVFIEKQCSVVITIIYFADKKYNRLLDRHTANLLLFVRFESF